MIFSGKNASLALTMLLLAGCSHKESGTISVKGNISHIDAAASHYPGSVSNGKLVILLNEIPFGGDAPPVLIAKDTLDEKEAEFTLSGNTRSGGIFSVEIENGPVIPLIHDADPISVSIDFSNHDHYYTVSGSPASEELRRFISDYSDKSRLINSALSHLDSLKRLSAQDSLILAATNEKNETINSLNTYLKDYLAKVNQPVVASFILGRAAQTLPQKDFENALNLLVQKFPEDASLSSLKTQYETFKKQASEMEKAREARSMVGKQAPELVLPDASGKNIALSSFRGKFVLVDFWASWCRPCREENPNVVAAYTRFRDKNFTILGVSLDKKKEDWLQAIKADRLNWTQVSDLAFWNSKAVSTFGFDGIPYNVLLDPGGKIIGEGLRGQELVDKLNEVLK